ncbi:NAD(P) transhydrogenase subunit alpha [Actinophytocola algeriensis]|uniref:proton-translocating NAD(P)(+) transhydrogenase n=1 Tax=Actinophytocola algeriensis TaxID=1768010 RepID=A0A7W7QDF4_9PSEU|nr:NAD(P) transhydrogenase subunit alpha [Actinophytocola algeriensis]MBB4911597.1 NAD(P) transhydrogenase subunit alpha [Actinophytocola algeriensis]MBE1473415.1 NAD(P) transhydrogenase subunit alpha [Actinophytocola algeriensis]
MKVAIAGETRPDERRVALVPDLVPRLAEAGLEVVVEPGAGEAAGFTDDDYRHTGAAVDSGALDGAGVVLSVQPIAAHRFDLLAPNAITVSFLPVAQELDLVRALRDAGHTAFAMELVPRIARAQAMDALSSQAFVAGYRAALVAAERLPKFLPLAMTASGTIPPARVLVLGAGVAGLQAIATSRRLGAVVHAYDVRAAAADEVRSLGAEFVELELPTLEGTGGYARQMGEERARLQRELLAPHVAAADVLITTAAVPGRPAPLLVTTDMVALMRPGSVVVDLAAESGGNVEGVKPGEELTVDDVLLWGGRNVPSQLPAQASRLYSTNVVNLLLLMRSGETLAPDFDDEIISACCVTHRGEVRHAPTRDLLGNGGGEERS